MTPLGVIVAHLARALDAHGRWCRANGHTMPPELTAAELVLARSGQGRTSSAEAVDLADTAPMPPLAHTYAEAGELLRVSERHIRRLVKDGVLVAISVGGCPRIHSDDLADYATNLREASPTQGELLMNQDQPGRVA